MLLGNRLQLPRYDKRPRAKRDDQRPPAERPAVARGSSLTLRQAGWQGNRLSGARRRVELLRVVGRPPGDSPRE